MESGMWSLSRSWLLLGTLYDARTAREGLELRRALREVLKHSRRLIGSKSFISALCVSKASLRYVLNAARAAMTSDPNHSQRVVYISVKQFIARIYRK